MAAQIAVDKNAEGSLNTSIKYIFQVDFLLYI